MQQVTQDGTLEQTTDEELQNLKENTEVLKKRRKFDKPLQEAAAKVDAEVEKRQVFPALPQDFFENEQERLQTYQVLAQIESFEELAKFKETIEKDRFHIPPAMRNLIEILDLKLLMQEARILAAKTVRSLGEMGTKNRRVILEFAEVIDPQHIEKLLGRNSQWQFTTQMIKIDLDALGPEWLKELKETVRLFIKK